MTKALIVEDEPLLAAELREELGRIWPELEICAVSPDGYAAWRDLERYGPDLLFLDVQLPGMDGLQLARLVGQRAHIVFVTAFNHFAVQAFDEGAVDYLVKPLDSARLARAVRRVKEKLGSVPVDLKRLVERVSEPSAAAAGPLRWITVQNGRELRLVTVDDICYFRADHKYVSVVTGDSESLINKSLKELMVRLDPEIFLQVHRGTVVNLNAVRSIDRAFGGGLTLHLKVRDEKLKVSPGYAHQFKQW